VLTAGGPSGLPTTGSLRDKVALITGGSRGIGFAVASALIQRGARVGLVSRTKAELRVAAEALARVDGGARVVEVCGSITDPQFCRAAVEQVAAQLGEIDVLVNNAGVQGPIGLLEELNPDDWVQTFAVNLFGAAWMIQAVLPSMKRRGRGSIINISGGGATGPRERFSAYAASKAALVRLTETIAKETAGTGVRVNAIAPGAVNTRMTDEVERSGDRAGKAAHAEVRKQRETGGTPPELAAELVAFLASDESAGITGRLISAVWDDWRAMQNGSFQLVDPDWFTLRRVTPTSS
jgi:3-oxoacyl-[acyl-carrier protein] reductase